MRKAKKPEDPLAGMRRVKRPQPEHSDSDTVRAHEEGAADLFGGSRHRGSGASAFLKSDASSVRYQIECKQTANASVPIKLDWLRKISAEGLGCNRVPVVHVRFLRDVVAYCPRDWILMPADEVARLLEAARA